jgi:hypothetical protein
MPQSSKKNGMQTEKQSKMQEFNLNENFELYESKYHFLEELKAKVDTRVSGVSDEKLKITVLLREKIELEQQFLNPDINIVPWLRTGAKVIGDNQIANEIYEHSERYVFDFQGEIDHFTTDLSKRKLKPLIERYQNILPFEIQFLGRAKGKDISNAGFITYIFQVCHKYNQYVESLIDKTALQNNSQIIQDLIEKMGLKTGPKISAQSLIIVLSETKLMDNMIHCMGHGGYQKFYKLIGKIIEKDKETIRKIREDMVGSRGKNNPYDSTKNIEEAVELLDYIGYSDIAIKLKMKFHL